MKLGVYLKDKVFELAVLIISLIFINFILYIFTINIFLVISINITLIFSIIIIESHEFVKKKKFYNNFSSILNNLDKKYLITSFINSCDFLEGNILLEYLYEIDKSFSEQVNIYKYSNEEFKEYIELWCHEIKTPVSTTKLILENNKSKISNSISEEIVKIDNYIEQVLFYAKSGITEKDYIINEINIKNVVNDVIKRNKKDILNKKIKINIFDKDIIIKSDAKWLEFIINQIIVNSIKYSKEKDCKIEIKCNYNKNNVILEIIDNGIGIKQSEIDKVFNKGFTGTNGRINHSSTGFGLYLCKKLSDKLNININIESKEMEYTKVSLIIPNSSMYS